MLKDTKKQIKLWKTVKLLNDLKKLGNEELAVALYDFLKDFEIEQIEIENKQKDLTGDKGDKGDRGLRGKKGKRGARGEKGRRGRDGKNGKNGIDGKNGKNGIDGKDGSPDTPKQIKEKLELLKKDDRLSASAIKDLEKYVEERVVIQENLGQGGDNQLTIQEEGVDVSQGVRKINFIGGNITATRLGNGVVAVSVVASSSINYADAETPTGSLDGVNDTFTLANTPSPTSSLQVYLNGVLQNETTDYTLLGDTITFTTPPYKDAEFTPTLLVYYRY